MSSEPTVVAFIGAAHIHTPGFIGMINKRPAGEIQVKYVYDHDTRRSEKRAGELAGAVRSGVPVDFLSPAAGYKAGQGGAIRNSKR